MCIHKFPFDWPMRAFIFLCLNLFESHFIYSAWLPFPHLFECLTIFRNSCIIIRFIHGHLLLRFAYSVINSHLICHSTIIEPTMFLFVSTQNRNITRWRICFVCSSLSVRQQPYTKSTILWLKIIENLLTLLMISWLRRQK